MQNKFYFILFLLFAFYFLICLSTVSNYPPAMADSDEFIAAGFSFSPTHPPGYPIQTFLTYVLTQLPIPASLAFKTNLLSVICHSLTVVFVYLTSLKLLNLIKTKSKIKLLAKQIIAITSALILGFSFLFWTYANVLEVMALNNFLAILLLYLALIISQQTKVTSKYLFIFSAVLGLSLAHHQTIILIIPSLLILILSKIWKKGFQISNFKLQITCLFIVLISFSLSYLLLFLFNNSSPIAWYFDKSINGIIALITRQDFIQANQGNAYLTSFYLPENFRALQNYLSQSLWQHLGWPILALIILGVYSAFKNLPQKIFWALLVGSVLTGPAVAFYLTLPDPNLPPAHTHMIMGLTHRIYLLGYVVMSLFLPLAFYQILIWLKNPKLVFVFLFLPIFYFFINHQVVNLKTYSYPSQYAQQVLASAEPNSIIICFSDISCFSYLHQQTVFDLEKNVVVVPAIANLGQTYRQQNHPQIAQFDKLPNPNRINQIIAWGLKNKRSVYLAEVTPFYLQHLGLDGQNYQLQPHGYLYQVKKDDIEIRKFNYPVSQKLAKQNYDPKHELIQAFKATLMQHHAGNATLYARAGQDDLALYELDLANRLYPNQPEVNILINKLKSPADR